MISTDRFATLSQNGAANWGGGASRRDLLYFNTACACAVMASTAGWVSRRSALMA